MKLNLDRDIVFFDIESTGLHVLNDRIIQLAMVKIKPDGQEIEKTMLINPGMVLISEEASQIHGITVNDVRNKPTFDQVAKEIYDFIKDCDLGGYNSNRFDIPMLVEELSRAGYRLDLNSIRTIDVQRIFYKMEPRTLSAAYRFYCNKKMENAHDALVDVRATIDVFKGQLKMYDGVNLETEDGILENPIINDIQQLHDFTNDLKTLDATQKLRKDVNGVVVFNFGKHNNKPVGETMFRDRQYYNWMLNKDFSVQVKEIIKEEFEKYVKTTKTT